MIDSTTIPCGVKTSLVSLFHRITSPPNLFNYKSSSRRQLNITHLAIIPSKSLIDLSILVILIYRMTSPQNPFDLCQVNITPLAATLSDSVAARSHGYGDVTVTYKRRSEIPSRIYAKHQYRQESEYGSTVVIYIPAIIAQVHNYHKVWYNISKNIWSLRSTKEDVQYEIRESTHEK